MTMTRTLLSLALCSTLFTATSALADKAHWTYSGEAGPAHWGSLSPAYGACSTGKNQSPVDLTAPLDADLKALELNYSKGGNKVVNNSHTIMVSYAKGSTLTVDGHKFALKQFHFHAPSENKINGKSYPMEAHLVHADEKGNLAVVAVMFEEGAANAMIAKVWETMPKEAGTADLKDAVAVTDILPKERDYYRFSGSLTTPPCSEGVLWLVMKKPMTVSKEQVEAFSHVMHHPNNRPIQALNARKIIE